MDVEPINPYAPPLASLETEIPIPGVDRLIASRQRRLWGYVIDAVILSVVASFASYLLVRFDWLTLAPRQVGWMWTLKVLFNPLEWIAVIAFYFVFEGIWQRTPGKVLLGMRVVSADGTRPTFASIFLRTFIRLIPFEVLSIFSKTKTCWHDRWSSTRVISLKKLQSLEAGTLEAEEAEILQRDNRPADWHVMPEAKRAIWEMRQQAAKKDT